MLQITGDITISPRFRVREMIGATCRSNNRGSSNPKL